MEDTLKYWLWLHKMYGGTVTFKSLIDRYGDPKTIYRALKTGRELLGIVRSVDSEKLASFTEEDAEKLIGVCNENGWHIIPYDSEYYPSMLRFIKDPPAVLFAEGDREVLKSPYMFGIVGTRKPTDSARGDAFLLGLYMSLSGACVVSGGADGTDSCAHEGACLGSGGTVAVLGRGLGAAPVKKTEYMSGRLTSKGVYLTEFFPFAETRAFNFPKRNRIISGMSLAVAVIEAGEKSGAVITAEAALKQSRKLFVPAQDVLPSPGCKKLLIQGAQQFRSAGDILGCFMNEFPEWQCDPEILNKPIKSDGLEGRYYLMPGWLTPEEYAAYCTEDTVGTRTGSVAAKPEKTEEKKNKTGEEEKTEPEPAPVMKEVPAYLSADAVKIMSVLTAEPVNADDILAASGLEASALMCALTELELEDLITFHSGNRFSLK